jgi:hypothetical protein
MPHASYPDMEATAGPGGRLYTGHLGSDAFPSPIYFSGNVPSNKPAGSLERDSYPLFLEAPSLYHYYGGVHPQSMAAAYATAGIQADYVNPNAVLPMNYNGRFKTETQVYEEQQSINMSAKPTTNKDASVTKQR